MRKEKEQKGISRREFLAGAGAISTASLLAGTVPTFGKRVGHLRQPSPPITKKDKMICSILLHLSYNMWADHPVESRQGQHGYMPDLCFDEGLWNDLVKKMVNAGMTMVIIDLGDGVKYASHPEIAVNNAWSVGKLKDELAKLRAMGLEPIPKLNFATTHDVWLGPYAKCVSTDKYYGVCKDLITEVIDIFDKPRFFHLGMDEETAQHQVNQHYVVIRQFDLWWNDLYFYVDKVEKGGSRAWIWSDYMWHHPDVFFKKMPKSILQSNWYYGTDFSVNEKRVKAYDELEKHGYDQVPTGSNHSNNENMGLTIDYCKKQIDTSRLLGFMIAPWRPTIEYYREHHTNAIEQIGKAVKSYGV